MSALLGYDLDLLLPTAPEVVFAAWADPATWPQWQPGLVSVTTLPDGSRGLRFEYPDGVREMVEVVEVSEAPHRYDAVYTSGPVSNWCRNTFAPTADGSTAWTQSNEWEFGEMGFDDDDLERFRNTTLSLMQGFRMWLEGTLPAIP